MQRAQREPFAVAAAIEAQPRAPALAQQRGGADRRPGIGLAGQAEVRIRDDRRRAGRAAPAQAARLDREAQR
jgi:hypothetical protein